MPLRALLLLPSGEQPTTTPTQTSKFSKFRQKKDNGKPRVISPLDLASPSKTSPNRHSTLSEGQENNGAEQSYPSPVGSGIWNLSSKPLPSSPSRTERDNRDSNQTYQTTLTLPSTSGSSRAGTDHTPSPPLSPSPTTSSASGSANYAHTPSGSIYTRDAEYVGPSRGKSVVPPTLFLNLTTTTMQKDERGRPLLKINTSMPRVGSGVRYRRTESRYEHADLPAESESESSADPRSEGTARQAVNERIQHLLVTSPSAETVDPSSTPTPSRFSFLSTRASVSRPTSTSQSRSPSRPTSKMLTPVSHHPPSTHSTLHPPSSHHRPKRKDTQKKKYDPTSDRPPPPPTKGLPPFKILSDEDLLDLLGEERIRVLGAGRKVETGWKKIDRSRLRSTTLRKLPKGKYIRLITLPPLDNDKMESYLNSLPRDDVKGIMPVIQIEDDELAEEVAESGTSLYTPTVYMTEIVASQYDLPVACMMWPPPLPASPLSRTFSRPVSSVSATSGSGHLPIHSLPAQAYQLPLPHLTRVQKNALQSAKLLVYAVPREYIGPVPPPELEYVQEEVLAPWASAPINTASTLVGESGLPTTPRTPGFGASALSPRWPEGMWNSRNAESSKRSSGASQISMTTTAPRKSGDSNGEEGVPQTATWSSGFSALRARAHGYYAAKAANSSTPATPSIAQSASDPSSLSAQATSPLAPPSTAPIAPSRSFSSFFSRSNTANTSASGTSDSGYGSSTADSEQGHGAQETTKLEVKLASSPIESAETPTTASSTPNTGRSWRSWGARWGTNA